MKFHTQILSKEQKNLLSFIGQFNPPFFLVWWTAIALQLGHRKSIDFDLFAPNLEKLPLRKIKIELNKFSWSYQTIINQDYHYEIFLNWVKISRFAYMFSFSKKNIVNWDHISMPDLLHLSAMKVHAISKRAKRKDYVDIYFLIKMFWTKRIMEYTKDFFGWEINTKLFASQLAYFEDVDYTEEVEFMPWFETSKKQIQDFLVLQSMELMK